MRFTPRPDGSGLYCADGAAALGGEIGTLCQGWQQPGEPDKALAAKIASACEDKPFYGKPALVKRKVPRRIPSSPSASPFGASRSPVAMYPCASCRGRLAAQRRRRWLC